MLSRDHHQALFVAQQLARAGSLISGRVRREERELFPLIESALAPDELTAVAAALEQAND
jgi:hypothetical protein